MFRRSFHFLKALLFLLGIFASANLSASNGEFDGESRITRERSGLFAGEGGFDINVGDATSLTGSLIHSESVPDQNRLAAGSLDVASLKDLSKWSLETGSVSLSGSYNGGGTNGAGMGLPTSDGGDKTRTVESAISAGELIVENGILPEVRRDTQALLAEEILDSLPDDLQQQLAEAQEIAAAAKEASASLAKAVGDISTMLEDPARKQETERIIGSYKRGELSAEEAGSQINAALQNGNGWSENGLNRIITHALTQGLIAGFAGGDVGAGLQGVGGVIAGNLGSRLATSLNETFGLTGSTADFSQNFFSTAMGALAGGGTGGFIAGSVDENNRQLHGSELAWIFENAKKFSELTGLSLNEALNLLLIAGHAGVDGLEEALVGRESESYREKIAQAQAFLATNPSGLFKATDAEKFDDPLEKWMAFKILNTESDVVAGQLVANYFKYLGDLSQNRPVEAEFWVENILKSSDPGLKMAQLSYGLALRDLEIYKSQTSDLGLEGNPEVLARKLQNLSAAAAGLRGVAYASGVSQEFAFTESLTLYFAKGYLSAVKQDWSAEHPVADFYLRNETRINIAMGLSGALSRTLLATLPTRPNSLSAELLATKTGTQLSVDDKLARYLLNPTHPIGGPKSRWFEEALGFTRSNSDDLARQLTFDPSKAVQTAVTEHGTKFNQIIDVVGANGRKIPVKVTWIRNNDGVVRIVTAVPGN